MDNYEPPGFSIIRIFQSVTGICYWKYSSIAILNAIVLLVTITLSVLLILLQIPCLIICSYGATTTYDVFNISSDMFSLFLTSVIQIFVCIFNTTSFVLWAQDIKKFFSRIRVFSRTFHLELQPPQETRLLSTSIKLIFFVLLAVFVQIMVYLFVYHPDLYDTQNSNGTLIDLRPPALTGVNFQRSVQIIEGVMKFKITADSYASVTVYLYFMQLVTLTIKRVELRFEKFVYVSSKRMIEGAKVTFIEVQNVLDDIDKLFGSTTAFTLMAHFSIHLIGLVQLSRGFIDSNSRRIAFYGLVNSILGLMPLYLSCKKNIYRIILT